MIELENQKLYRLRFFFPHVIDFIQKKSPKLTIKISKQL